MDGYGLLESRGWRRPGRHRDPPRRTIQSQFYGEVLGRFAARGQGTVHELSFGDELVARGGLQIGNNDFMVVGLKTNDR